MSSDLVVTKQLKVRFGIEDNQCKTTIQDREHLLLNGCQARDFRWHVSLDYIIAKSIDDETAPPAKTIIEIRSSSVEGLSTEIKISDQSFAAENPQRSPTLGQFVLDLCEKKDGMHFQLKKFDPLWFPLQQLWSSFDIEVEEHEMMRSSKRESDPPQKSLKTSEGNLQLQLGFLFRKADRIPEH
jgi:hypothetical protein